MTQETYVDNLKEVILKKSKLEKELNIKIENRGKLVFVEGSPENEYLSIKVLEAINLGFSAEKAILLKDERIILQILNIKNITRRNDLERIRARIIGTRGKTIENLKKLSECEISLKNNHVGIIGSSEHIEEAIIALKSLIQGSKQGNVYARLEREGKKRRLKSEEIIKNEFKRKKAKL